MWNRLVSKTLEQQAADGDDVGGEQSGEVEGEDGVESGG